MRSGARYFLVWLALAFGAGASLAADNRDQQLKTPERLKMAQDYRIFTGAADPATERSEQTVRRLDMRDDLARTVIEYPNLDTSDPTAGRGGAAQHAAAAVPSKVPFTDITVSDLGYWLRSQMPPRDDAHRNFYAGATRLSEQQLLQRIRQSGGQLTPAEVMRMSLEISDGNYTMATLTAANLLKNVAYTGRHATELYNKQYREYGVHAPRMLEKQGMSLNPDDGYVLDVASRLVNLRGEPQKTGDKLGPWYHVFSLMFLGSITSKEQAHAMMVGEHTTRQLKWGSVEDKEKAEWDYAALSAMDKVHPVIYEGKPSPFPLKSQAADEGNKDPINRLIRGLGKVIKNAANAGRTGALLVTGKEVCGPDGPKPWDWYDVTAITGSEGNRQVFTLKLGQKDEVPVGKYRIVVSLTASSFHDELFDREVEVKAGKTREVKFEECKRENVNVSILDDEGMGPIPGAVFTVAGPENYGPLPAPADLMLRPGSYRIQVAPLAVGIRQYAGMEMAVAVTRLYEPPRSAVGYIPIHQPDEQDFDRNNFVVRLKSTYRPLPTEPANEPAKAAASIQLDPGYLKLNVGDRYEVLARVFDAQDREIPDAAVTWISSAPGVAAVDASGGVRGVARGEARVTAKRQWSGGSVSASLPVWVESGAMLGSCRIVNAPGKLPARGGDITLRVETTGTDGKPLAGTAIAWSGSNDVVALVNPTTGHVATEQPGKVTVTALVKASEGHEISCYADIEVEKRYATLLVSGQVVDAAGKPVAGASVQAAGGPAVTSGADGRFTTQAGSGPHAEGAEFEVKATAASGSGNSRAKVQQAGVVKDVTIKLGGAATTTASTAAASDAVKPVHLFRIWEPGKPQTADFLLYWQVHRSTDGKMFNFPDGNGGVYWREGEDLGVYTSEAAICAVLRGHGKFRVDYNLYWGSVTCPKEGPIARPQPVPATVAKPGSGTLPGSASAPGGKAPPMSLAAGMIALEMMVGDVRYYLDAPSATQPLTPNQPIPSGATLVVGKASRVDLRFSDNSVARVAENSTAKVTGQDGKDGAPELNLRQGSAEIESTPGFEGLERAPLRTRTPHAMITKEGTRYRVWVDAAGTRVEVTEGKITLKGNMLARADSRWETPGKRSFPRVLPLAAGERGIAYAGFAGATSAAGSLPPALARPDPWNDAEVQRLLDEWLRTAVPPVDKPGIVMHYNEWAQPLSQAARSTGAPDRPADWSRHRYLWENRMRYPSTRLCTMGEYVERTLKGVSLSDCPKLGAAGAAASGNVAGGAAAGTSGQPVPRDKTAPAAAVASPSGFEGDWLCAHTNSDGVTSRTSARISRTGNGSYELRAEGWSQPFGGGMVDSNTLKFFIADLGGEMSVSFRRNGQGLSGTTYVKADEGVYGKDINYAMSCRPGIDARPVDEGIPDGKR